MALLIIHNHLKRYKNAFLVLFGVSVLTTLALFRASVLTQPFLPQFPLAFRPENGTIRTFLLTLNDDKESFQAAVDEEDSLYLYYNHSCPFEMGK